MRVIRVGIHGFKGIDCDVTWAPVVVLFGRNDAGKSNFLEALLLVLSGLRHPPTIRELFPNQVDLDNWDWGVDIELAPFPDDDTTIGSADYRALTAQLGFHASWLFPIPERINERPFENA